MNIPNQVLLKDVPWGEWFLAHYQGDYVFAVVLNSASAQQEASKTKAVAAVDNLGRWLNMAEDLMVLQASIAITAKARVK